MSNLFDDRPAFTTRDGQLLHYIKTDGRNLICWKVSKDQFLENICAIRSISAVNVTESELKRINVWDNVSESVQKNIHESDSESDVSPERKDNYRVAAEEFEEVQIEKKLKKKRNAINQFKDYPEFLTCKCGRETKANYYYLSKKAEEKGVEVMDLVNGYVCQVCHPTKGRKKKA